MNIFNLNPNYSKRVYGLDVFRAMAILLVVMGHGGFIIDKALPGFPYVRLIDGVELFFVLSGFLIGTILMKIYESPEGITGFQLMSFWKRRWFRTLPNYYLVLGLNVFFVYTGIIQGNIEMFNWKFLFFLQNFSSYFTDFFWESWSLTIEEWFYILTPVTMLLIHFTLGKIISRKNTMLVVITVYLLFPLIYRYSISGEQLDLFWQDVKFRKVVITRLDAIMYGVLFAWIKFYYGRWWKPVALPMFIAGLSLMYFSMHLQKADPLSLYSKTIYFSLTGLGAAMLLPYADGYKSFKTAFGKAMTHISLISYSMYLINLALVAQVIEVHFPPTSGFAAVITYMAYWFIVVFLSTIMYRYFEKPVMDLREKTTVKTEIR